MELRQLKYFVSAADALNFSSAAKSMNITQSTLSQQIKQLENELGDELFYRNSHEVMLTEAGRELLPFAIKTVSDAENCRQRITDLKQITTGRLNIGVTYSFGQILIETLFNFTKLYEYQS